MMVVTLKWLGTDAAREPEGVGWYLFILVIVPTPNGRKMKGGTASHSSPGPASVPWIKAKSACFL